MGTTKTIKTHNFVSSFDNPLSTTMGNTLRTSAMKKKLQSSSKSSKQVEDLSGMEILIDSSQADCVSEAFGFPAVDPTEFNDRSGVHLSHYHTECSENLPSRKNSKKTESSSSSSGRESADLMACIIPGMDPAELLQLVEECAKAEQLEREMEQSMEFQQCQKRSEKRRNRAKNALNSIDV
jgi:hypothetical protein